MGRHGGHPSKADVVALGLEGGCAVSAKLLFCAHAADGVERVADARTVAADLLMPFVVDAFERVVATVVVDHITKHAGSQSRVDLGDGVGDPAGCRSPVGPVLVGVSWDRLTRLLPILAARQVADLALIDDF